MVTKRYDSRTLRNRSSWVNRCIFSYTILLPGPIRRYIVRKSRESVEKVLKTSRGVPISSAWIHKLQESFFCVWKTVCPHLSYFTVLELHSSSCKTHFCSCSLVIYMWKSWDAASNVIRRWLYAPTHSGLHSMRQKLSNRTRQEECITKKKWLLRYFWVSCITLKEE